MLAFPIRDRHESTHTQLMSANAQKNIPNAAQVPHSPRNTLEVAFLFAICQKKSKSVRVGVIWPEGYWGNTLISEHLL